MATFFVGQRIKKVRGLRAVGVIARVGAEPPALLNQADGCDMTVVLEQSAIDAEGICRSAGHLVATRRAEWEPILPDGHRSCDEDFKRDLDRLLEREGVQA